MIPRILAEYAAAIFTKYPVVTVTGPRQSGKTTLARATFADKPYANLENPVTRQFAQEDPLAFLNQYPEGAVIDEIQRVPDLLSYIQVIVDERGKNSLFVLTGSQQFELMRGISQSLAGRTALLKLLPFSIPELSAGFSLDIDEMLFKGFYPRIYAQDLAPAQAYGDYFETYVERDLRQLVNVKDLSVFQRFVRLCAGRCGQLLNLNGLANDTGISQSTAREWMTVLEASYIVFLLQPFHANIGKRLIKSPKMYFYDVGLASWLCGIEEEKQVATHPLRGSLFENMVIMEVLKYRYNHGKRNNLYFYRDSNGNEIDLIYTKGNDMLPIEIKSGQTITPAYFSGLKKISALFPDQLPWPGFLIYGGETEQARQDIKVLRIFSLPEHLDEIERQ
ncbi:MAG: ATP-binding protein [Proteobacteria bacterium]|nr:ATP-binding protein [Pseudomonadota bacterium]MBU4297415.1 ATP-binding protein [Pseudomonadota bacterium]MCG2748667.1 ATP-binding protein [Desulfobulbaceae bacterium]